jgi:hypothetical protein
VKKEYERDHSAPYRVLSELVLAVGFGFGSNFDSAERFYFQFGALGGNSPAKSGTYTSQRM